jgi:dihydroorotate dehydrogenase
MIRPWFWLPARVSHSISGLGIEAAACFSRTSDINKNLQWNPLNWKGLEFNNRLGIAGGPQKGNPGIVIDRNLKQLALWNKMGFPSKGSDFVLKKIKNLKRQVPLFINIGKNRETPLEKAGDDYIYLAEKFCSHADALVVNISSPNTPGLRNLAQVESLSSWLANVIKSSDSTPVLLKLSPDMAAEDFENTVNAAVQEGISGFVLTNTTLERSPTLTFPREGGVSGLPLKEKSLHALEQIQKILGNRRSSMLIVSCGGVMTARDVFERISKGADLVQTYSALVFNGPGFLKDVALEWKMLNPKKIG